MKTPSRLIILLAGLVLCTVCGVLYAWSIFVVPLEQAFGWQRPETSLTFTFMITFFSLGMFAGGKLLRFGPARAVQIGGALLCVGLLWASRIDSVIGLYLSYGVVSGFGIGIVNLVPAAVCLRWYPERKGLVSGLLTMALALGTLLFGLPCFEPATAQEMKDMTVAAFALSAQMGMPVMVRATTRVAHSRGVVELGDIRPKAGPRHYEKDYAFVPLPGNAVRHHKRLVERMRSLVPVSDASPFNRVEGPADTRLGVVASSAAVNYVLDAVKECGLSDTVGVFRLGMAWPLPENALLEFLRGKDTVLVLEELEPLVEEALRAMAQKNGLTLTILGKGTADLSTLYEYTPARVSAAVAEAFGVADVTPAPLDLTDAPQLVNRPPSLCAGCPHRMSYYGVKLGCEGRDVIFATDIGCYSLGFMPPLRMADIGVCMGAAASMPAGLELAVGPEQRIVGFIGDSTLFHSGLTGIANAVYNHHRFVLVVLDNMVTAMTGHQPSPGRDASLPQAPGTPPLTSIDMEAVIRALGVEHIQTVRPTNLKKVAEATRAALDHDGVSVIICREPCPLHMRRLSKAKKPVFGIDGERCVNCHTCVDTFGCPAFQLRDGKVSIDPVQCIGCAVCAQVCPNNAIRPQK